MPPSPVRGASCKARNAVTAGTSSKRLKGLEPSTFCMASRRTVTRRAGLPPANCAKRPVQPRRVVSRISPRFAGVLSTNCPPRTGADRASRAPGALRVCLDMSNRRPRAPLLLVTGCGSGMDSDRAPADARCSSAACVSALSVDAFASGAKRERSALTASRCSYELDPGLRIVGLHAQQHRRRCPIARHLLTTGRGP